MKKKIIFSKFKKEANAKIKLAGSHGKVLLVELRVNDVRFSDQVYGIRLSLMDVTAINNAFAHVCTKWRKNETC